MTTKDKVDDTLGYMYVKYFTTLDLALGYWQVHLDDKSRPKIVFTTYKGLLEFVRKPFSLCNECPGYLTEGNADCFSWS